MKWITACLVLALSTLIASASTSAEEEPEYQNPEIDLKFNLKEENDGLSPQNKLPSETEATKTVTADVDWDIAGVKIGRNPVHVGTWTSEPVTFDIVLNINSFDVWWEDLEDSDNSCEWTITIQVNDQDVSEDVSDCQHNGAELEKGSHNLGTSINLMAGDTIGIDLVFEGWDDIKIYYDNVTYDTGLGITGSHVYLFNGIWKGNTVSIEFAEAWPTNWKTNLDGGYVMVMGDDGYMADNDMANVMEGNQYSFQGNNSTTIDVTSTVIEWAEITGTGIKIMMDYTIFDHMPGNSTGNGTEGNPPRVTLILEKPIALLGDEGGILGLPGFEMALAIPAIAFVARRFKN